MFSSKVTIVEGHITTKSDGMLERLTGWRHQRVCHVDFSRGIVEERIHRAFKKRVVNYLRFNQFNAVDYSYRELGFATKDGVQYENDEFHVSLRFASDRSIFPIAVLRGWNEVPVGNLARMLAKYFPYRADGYEAEKNSRSLANQLCERMNLRIEM